MDERMKKKRRALERKQTTERKPDEIDRLFDQWATMPEAPMSMTPKQRLYYDRGVRDERARVVRALRKESQRQLSTFMAETAGELNISSFGRALAHAMASASFKAFADDLEKEAL